MPWRWLAQLCRVLKTLSSGIGEALPALPAAGHPWAQQDSFQGGAPRTAVCRAAASRTAAQSTVAEESAAITCSVTIRLGVLFGQSLKSFLSSAKWGTVAASSPNCELSQGIPHHAWDRGSATRTSRSGPSLGATGFVPGWCAENGGIRAAASRAAAQSTVRGICAGYLLGNFWLGVLFGIFEVFFPPQSGVRLPPPPPIAMSQGIPPHARDRGSAPALLAAGHPWAQQDSFQGGAPGTVVLPCCRKPGSGPIHGPRNLRRLLACNFRLEVLFGDL